MVRPTLAHCGSHASLCFRVRVLLDLLDDLPFVLFSVFIDDPDFGLLDSEPQRLGRSETSRRDGSESRPLHQIAAKLRLDHVVVENIRAARRRGGVNKSRGLAVAPESESPSRRVRFGG